jgi:hypothetical protein
MLVWFGIIQDKVEFASTPTGICILLLLLLNDPVVIMKSILWIGGCLVNCFDLEGSLHLLLIPRGVRKYGHGLGRSCRRSLRLGASMSQVYVLPVDPNICEVYACIPGGVDAQCTGIPWPEGLGVFPV